MVDLAALQMDDWDYADWTRYFSANDNERLAIDFSREDPLPASAMELITPSARAFQKGEGSDGRFLLSTAEAFAREHGESEYPAAMRLFVAEENWHSAYLKKYLDFHGIALAQTTALDSLFRRMRKLGGLKCEVTVLVTAEMIALTYYRALAECTDSAALKSICAQMLHDELPHIVFQSLTLSHFGTGPVNATLRRALMFSASMLVWGAFSNVFRTAGLTFREFLGENNGYLEQSIDLARKLRAQRNARAHA